MSTWSPFREDVGQTPAGEGETWLSGLPLDPAPTEEFDFGEAEAELEETHPVSALLPGLPAGVLEALSRGLTSVAIGLAAAAGFRDVDRLTDLVFYFRHPNLVGHRIGPEERTLAQEWVAIRDRVVRPALGSAQRARPPASPPTTAGDLSSAHLHWPGASSEKLAFMRAVYDAHAAHSRASGRRFVADLPHDALAPVDGHQARKDAAAAATALLAEANDALAAAGLAATTRIGIVSAYRPATLQFEIWQGRNFDGSDRGGGFPYYYEQALKEGVLHPGDYGADAVQSFAHYLGGYIASPGYSNHQDGLAFDFGTGLVGKQLGAIGWKSWFRHWLEQNAARYHFVPLATEAWHWTYTPPAQHEYELDGAPLEAEAASGIRAGRLEVAHVPLLAHHRGSGPDLVLAWNDMPAAPRELDVVVHLHGYWYPHLSLTRDIEPVSGLDLTPLDGGSGAGRVRPTLTVLPRGNDTGVKQPHGPYDAYTFPALVTRTGLPALVDYALGQFAAAHGGTVPRPARLILTAHSGGGLGLVEILQHHDPHQLHVFDALYWSPAPLIEWARNRIRRDRAAGAAREYMEAEGGALRVFYQGHQRGGTRPNSLTVLRAISHEVGDDLAPRYRVEASGYDHFQIPRRYGWRVLADASADVPEAHTEPASAHETEADELDVWTPQYDNPPPVHVVEPFPTSPFGLTFGSAIAGMGGITGDHDLAAMCSAVADLTGNPANPPYAGVNDDEVLYPGSLQKISAMYAAFLLRAQVQAQVAAAVHAGLSTHTTGWEKPVIADLERGWLPTLRTEFPKLPPAGFPQLATIFEFTNTGDVKFRQTLSEACIECLGEFGTPTGGFGDWLRLTIRWSNNSAASRCIRALGYRYLNGALEKGGFFAGSAAHGLWLSGDYLGHDWIPNPPGNPQANRAGQPLTARWATAQGRTLSNMTATASQVCRFMSLIAQRKLIDAQSSNDMLELLDKSRPGTNSWVSIALANAHRTTDLLFSKIGIGDDDRYHDTAIVERTLASHKKVRYVVVGLGSKKGDIRDLYRLFVALDDVIAARHP